MFSGHKQNCSSNLPLSLPWTCYKDVDWWMMSKYLQHTKSKRIYNHIKWKKQMLVKNIGQMKLEGNISANGMIIHWPFKLLTNQHLISPNNDTTKSFMKITRVKEMITNLRSFDWWNNFPCQYQRKYTGMENMDTNVRVTRVKATEATKLD